MRATRTPVTAVTQSRRIAHMRGFVFVVDQRHEIDVVLPREQPQEMIGANTIATVGRVGNAMRQEQDAHGGGRVRSGSKPAVRRAITTAGRFVFP